MVSRVKLNQVVTAIVLSLVLASGSASDIEDGYCRTEIAWGVPNHRAFSFLPVDFFQQLPRLAFGCIKEAELVETIERLSRANNSAWWDAFLVHLHYADFGPVEGLDQQYLKSLAPQEPGLSGLYALVMQRATDSPGFWRTELSRIVREHPEVVGQIRSGDAPLHLDMAFLSDWIVEQDAGYLDLFVETVEWEHWFELAELVEPAQLSPTTFSLVLARHYKDGREPPEGWLSYFEGNLGDWMLLLLPEELRDADMWDLEHRGMFRIRNPMQGAIAEAMTAMGPLMAVSFLPRLLEHDSPIVRRVAKVLRLELIPSLAHFDQAVAAGVTPALLAAEADWDLVQALLRAGLQAEESSSLVSFVENLDCYELLRFSDSEPIPEAEVGRIAVALRIGIDECRK